MKLPRFPRSLNISHAGIFSAFVPVKDSVQRCVEAKASHMIDNKQLWQRFLTDHGTCITTHMGLKHRPQKKK